MKMYGVYGYPHTLYGLFKSGSLNLKYINEHTVIEVVIIKIIPVYKTTSSKVDDKINPRLITS